MRIAVAHPAPVPAARGGAERATGGLVAHICDHTPHRAELVTRPFPERTLAEVVTGYRTFHELDLSGFDRVVACKYPAWMVSHEHLTVLMFHPLRGLYDLWPPTLATTCSDPLVERTRRWIATRSHPGDIGPVLDELEAVLDRFDPDGPHLGRTQPGDADLGHPDLGLPGPLGHTAVHTLDRLALRPGRTRRHLALSHTVRLRPGYFPPGADPAVVYLPSDLAVAASSPRRHLLWASRLDEPKRVELALQAYRSVDTDIPLLVAGAGPRRQAAEELAAADGRVSVVGEVSDRHLAELYAGAVAVVFAPYDEDLGLVTLEAWRASSPVVTTTDSGGPAELVTDGVDGLVAEPTVEGLAAAIARLLSDRDLAAELGRNGAARAAEVTWTGAVDRVVGSTPSHSRTSDRPGGSIGSGTRSSRAPGTWATGRAARRPRAVVVGTYQVAPRRGGGQLRGFHLCSALARSFDVHVLALGPHDALPGTVELAAGLTETTEPRTWDHLQADIELASRIDVPLGDILGGAYVALTPRYLRAARTAMEGSDLVVAEHPYLWGTIERIDPSAPLVLDAHNVEVALKADLYGSSPTGVGLLELVRQVEGRAARGADLLVACSDDDLDELRRRYDTSATGLVVPNGVDTDGVEWVPPPGRNARRSAWLRSRGRDESRPVLLFVGSLHGPNVEAARLVHDLARRLDGALFVTIGRHAEAVAGEPLPANVVQLGQVDDGTRDELLGLADVALNPMLAGGGTNLKLLEYLAAGIPTVTSALGARGLTVEQRSVAVVAGVESFPDEIEALLADDERRTALSRAGREMVERHFDWRPIGDRYAGALAALVEPLSSA